LALADTILRPYYPIHLKQEKIRKKGERYGYRRVVNAKQIEQPMFDLPAQERKKKFKYAVRLVIVNTPSTVRLADDCLLCLLAFSKFFRCFR
jgi:hypothetical protein